jgi:hypothetical protein
MGSVSPTPSCGCRRSGSFAHIEGIRRSLRPRGHADAHRWRSQERESRNRGVIAAIGPLLGGTSLEHPAAISDMRTSSPAGLSKPRGSSRPNAHATSPSTNRSAVDGPRSSARSPVSANGSSSCVATR